jgi:hypothetical protein
LSPNVQQGKLVVFHFAKTFFPAGGFPAPAIMHTYVAVKHNIVDILNIGVTSVVSSLPALTLPGRTIPVAIAIPAAAPAPRKLRRFISMKYYHLFYRYTFT